MRRALIPQFYSQFGATKTGFWDKGKDEIQDFIDKHKCNTVCHALGLNWVEDDKNDPLQDLLGRKAQNDPLQDLLGRKAQNDLLQDLLGRPGRNVMAVENLVTSGGGKGKERARTQDGKTALTSIMVRGDSDDDK